MRGQAVSCLRWTARATPAAWLAARGMGAAAWWLHRLLADLLPGGLATLLAVSLAAVIYAGAALLLGAVGREEAMALPGGERLVRWLRLK